MRASVYEEEEFYVQNGYPVYDVGVLLDGVKQTLCVVADEERGYIERYDLDTARPVDEWATIVRNYGKVEIRRMVRT